MLEQIRFFMMDYRRMCGKRKIRLLYSWINRPMIGIWLYRFERSWYLTIGKTWSVVRVFLTPLLNLGYAYSNCEIHYKASIGGGIMILHASPGIVISGQATIGDNLTLVGGNTVGVHAGKAGKLIIGNNCYLGAHSVIIGPLELGDNLVVGACALVTKNFDGNQTLVGVPAGAKPPRPS